MNTLVRIFLNADLRCQHDGLKLMARKKSVQLDKLKPNEHVLFVNTAKNRIKMYSGNGVLSYYNSRRQIDVRAISLIPHTFSNNIEIAYNNSLKRMIEREFNKKNKHGHIKGTKGVYPSSKPSEAYAS